MGAESKADLKQMAQRLRELEGKLRDPDLPLGDVKELVRESAQLAAEAGSELERHLRTVGRDEQA